MNRKTVFEVVLDARVHRRTGKTTHVNLSKNRILTELPKRLAIMQYDGDGGFYLIHFDEAGEQLTDTYHDVIEDAMRQANREYLVERDHWQSLEE